MSLIHWHLIVSQFSHIALSPDTQLKATQLKALNDNDENTMANYPHIHEMLVEFFYTLIKLLVC